MAYASGKWANALCDYCGFTYKYVDLKPFIFNQVDTGLKLCPSCWTPDQPQLQVGKYNRTPEAIALLKPRPDVGKKSSTAFWGWAPVCSLTMKYTLTPPTIATA